MSVFLRRSCGAAIAYAVATQGAWADLTADDVWSDWQAYMSGMGYEMSGDQSSAGGVTTYSDVTMAMELPEEDAQFAMTIPEMTLTENGDGTVSIGFPDSFPMVIAGDVEGDPFRAELAYAQDAMEMVVSGSPEDITYDWSAASIALTLASLEVDGEPIPADLLKLAFGMTDIAGTSQMQIGDTRAIDQKFAAGSLTFDIAFDDPESDDAGHFKGGMDDLSFDGSGVLPIGVDASDLQSLIDAGFDFDGIFTYGQGRQNIEVTGDESFAMSSSSQGGVFKASMNPDHLGYDLTQNGVKLEVTSQDLPFPVEMAMETAGFKFDIPVQASDEAQPFALAMKLTDFTMSDILWSMFDPAGALPRDPATIVLDTSGTATVTVNFLDPAVAETLEATGAAPGELNSLTINELLISMVGAELSGTGDFTFDNSNLDAFDGFPAPIGAAQLQLVGANALLDKLIGMGLMSDSDALGARMMMGLLAVPGDAPDTLNSTIEFNEEGHISANGQRIK